MDARLVDAELVAEIELVAVRPRRSGVLRSGVLRTEVKSAAVEPVMLGGSVRR